MDRLVSLRKQRAECIQGIEHFEADQPHLNRFETPRAKASLPGKDSKSVQLRREKESLQKAFLQTQRAQAKVEKELRGAENQLKQKSMEVKVRQKQKQDLLLFKRKSGKARESCQADEALLKKYRTKTSKQLIEKIKKLGANRPTYTEKDRVIYNQLHSIENKQDTFKDQVGVIEQNKQAVRRHLGTCDRKIRALSLQYFDDFRASLERTFAKFEPTIELQASIVQDSQQTLVWGCL